MAKKSNQKAQSAPAVAEEKLYTTVLWKGVKQVFRCEKCGTNRDDKDSMIEHVLLHFPLRDQEKIFNQLVQEN